jgi:predicted nuclease of restriction endonuclease-like (RecB) superfamily
MNKPYKILINEIRELILKARSLAYHQVNTLAVMINFEVGRLIVEHEQAGNERAPYGRETLKVLSKELIKEFGQGYSVDNLQLMRSFFLTYYQRAIPLNDKKSETLSRKLPESVKSVKSETLSRIFQNTYNLPFKLSWSHYVELIKMDQTEREFYEVEAVKNNWSIRELRRQFNSSLFERVALSKNKEEVFRLASEGQIYEKPSDLVKQRYILEFLGLKEQPAHSESQLEQVIIDKIELFLLELGKGFLFEARQKRISFEGDDFYIDLVFYNRMLRCFVLIDLKIGKLTHGDIGQMQMYINYFDRIIKLPDENRTVGIILCKQNNKTVVEFTLPEGQDQIFSREYKLYLPDKKELKKQLELYLD